MPDITDNTRTITLPSGAAQDLVSEVFCKAGCHEEEARRIASRLVEADLRGHASHGISRTARYVQWLNDGILKANQRISIESENEVLAILNGNYGFGQSIGEQAVDLGIAKSRKHGVSVIALKNSGHLGCIADWAERAAEHNLASIHFVNVRGSLLVAPFGGKDARGGTSPICCGVPGPEGKPVILDFATSTVAEGKALVAYKGGAPLPDGAFVDSDGSLSSDPSLLYASQGDSLYPRPGTGTGALTAFGLHKGSGLNFFVEIFAGALTGSGTAGGIGETGRRKLCNGMLSFYVDVNCFDKEDHFAKEIRSYIEFVKSAAPIDVGGQVLVPGEKEMLVKQDRLANGIPVSRGVWSDILKTAEYLNIGRDRVIEICGSDIL